MSSNNLQAADVLRLCKLARLSAPTHEAQSAALVAQLNRFFDLAQAIQAVPIPADTAPLIHPMAMLQPVALPLADDAVAPIAPRAEMMRNAPAQAQGVFLVPRVIE